MPKPQKVTYTFCPNCKKDVESDMLHGGICMACGVLKQALDDTQRQKEADRRGEGIKEKCLREAAEYRERMKVFSESLKTTKRSYYGY